MLYFLRKRAYFKGLNLKNNNNLTPLDIICSKQKTLNIEVIKLFLNNPKLDKTNLNPLFQICRNDDLDVYLIFLSYGFTSSKEIEIYNKNIKNSIYYYNKKSSNCFCL